MATDPEPLELPADERDGWAVVDGSVETLFELPTVRVRGTVRQYEDERTREALYEATDGGMDHTIRFFATTRLGFEPPLPPGTTPAMIVPVLRPEARQSFTDRLHDRGLTDVEQTGRERIRLGDRTRVRLTRYTAVDPLPGTDVELPLECWLGVWTDGTVNVATSGYPTVPLAAQFDLEADEQLLGKSGNDYREEFRSLLRAVE
jgi:hypothetical protein